MDKNTITGLVLIGILLVGFSYLSRPSEEQIAAQKKYYDSIAVVQQQQEALKAKTEAALANENKGAAAAADSSALFFNAMHGTDSKVSIQNSVAEITFTTKGGRVYSAMLKEYKGQDKTNPVVLFDGDDATMSFNFYNKQGAIQTKDYYFEAVNKTDSSVTMRLAADNASYIDFIYTLKPNSYLMNFEIKATGMEGKLASTEYVDIDWTQRARQLEKGFTYENRLSELTYKVKGDNVDNLSAAKDDEKDLGNTAIDWVAFKNQFFCIHCRPGLQQGFCEVKNGTTRKRIYQGLFCRNEYLLRSERKTTDRNVLLLWPEPLQDLEGTGQRTYREMGT